MVHARLKAHADIAKRVRRSHDGSLSTRAAEAAVYDCLPAQSVGLVGLIKWAVDGGVCRAVEAWADADRQSSMLRPRPSCSTFQPIITAQLVDKQPSVPALLDALCSLIDRMDQLIDEARGPEPSERFTTQFERWAGYRPPHAKDVPIPPAVQYRFATEVAEGRAESIEWAHWQRSSEVLSRTWRVALLTVGQVILETPSTAIRARLLQRRHAELQDALARYPLKHDSDTDIRFCGGYEEYVSCADDNEAVQLRASTIYNIVSAIYQLPTAMVILEKLLAIKKGGATPVDVYSSKSPRARWAAHRIIQDSGGLHGESRDDAGNGPDAVEARRRIEQGEKAFLLKTIVVTRESDKPQPALTPITPKAAPAPVLASIWPDDDEVLF